MKFLLTHFLGLVMALHSFHAYSQHSQLQSFYSKYSSQEGNLTLSMSGELFTKTITKSSKNTQTRIQNVEVMVLKNAPLQKDLTKLKEEALQNNFESLSVNQELSNVDFMIKKSSKAISDVLVFIDDEKGVTILSLQGELLLKELAPLASLKFDGLVYFKEFENLSE